MSALIRIKGRDHRGIAEVIHEDAAIVAGALQAFTEAVRKRRKFCQMVFDGNERPNTQAIERIAQNAVMIRVRLVQP